MRGLSARHQWTIGAVTLIIIVVVLLIQFGKDHGGDGYPIKRVFKYSFTAKNASNHFIENANFWVYKPIGLNGNQKLINLVMSHPAKIEADKNGNEKLKFTVKNLPPYGSRVFTISAEMGINIVPSQMKWGNLEIYLRPGKNIESDNPRVQSIAKTLKAATSADTALKIFTWVNDNLSDAGYIERDHGALYALDSKRGDCTEYMNLFLALARSNGIPARGVAGYVYKESAVLKPRDYHNWAEVYIDGAWRVVDPLNKTIFKDESNYIAMRMLGDSAEDEDSNTQRFFGSDYSIKVNMN